MIKEEKKEFSCKIIENMGDVTVTGFKKGLLNTIKICFEGKPKRRDMEKIKKCLSKNKIKYVFGDQCLLIK